MAKPDLLMSRVDGGVAPVDDDGGSGSGAVSGTPLLLEYWQVVQRFKWIIIGIIAAAVIVGLIATLLMTPRYTATTRVEISRDQRSVTKVDGVESQEAGRDQEFYQTQYSLLQARSLAERVAKQMRLGSNDAFFAAHGIDPADLGRPVDPGASRIEARDQGRQLVAVNLLLQHVQIEPIRGSSLVDIKYTSDDPALSARIANAWAQQFIAASMERRFASTVDARRFLEGRLNDLRSRLERSEREAVGYAANSGIVSLGTTRDGQGNTVADRTLAVANLEALNTALTQATADRIAAQSRAGSGGGGPDTAGNASLPQLRQRRAEIQAEYAKLMVQFEPGYPAARALAEQIKALDTSIAREEGRVSSGRSTEYQEALEREQALRGQVADLRAQLTQQQRASIQYNIYQREADTNRQLYDALLQRYKEIGVAGVDANNISIVDAARTPESPSSPNLPINLAIALLAGVALAGVATFALNQIDEGIRDPAQVRRLLGVPLLGSVPVVENGDGMTALADVKSALSEAYLSIRSNLAFSTDHGVPRSLMVTSTRPAEGKSTTSRALATVLARTGKRVILLDGDMRNPSVHKMASLDNAAGLSNLLAGEDDWQRLTLRIFELGFDIITAGPQPPNAAELLSSDRLNHLLEQMLASYDHVIVDSPPILGLADAPLLARSVEGSLMVVEAEGVAARGVKFALGRLQAVHAHVYGVILTKLHSRHAGYGYGYGYDYHYGKIDA